MRIIPIYESRVKLTFGCGIPHPAACDLRDNAVMRKSDKIQKRYARAEDRIMCEDERWFVRTREGRRGPFRSRREAQAEARLFVDTMMYLNDDPALPDHIDRDDVPPVLSSAPGP